MKMLSTIQCGSIVVDKPELITIGSEETVLRALDIMSSRNIRSIPVLKQDQIDHQDPSKDFIAFLDLFDIVLFLVYGPNAQALPSPQQLKAFEPSLLSTPVGELCGIDTKLSTGRWSEIVFVDSSESVYDCLDYLCSGEKRVIVKLSWKGQRSLKCLSQIDVLKTIATLIAKQDSPTLRHVSEQSIGDAQLFREHIDAFDNLCLVSPDTSVLAAFRRMLTDKAEAVGVVREGILVDTLSPSDIRSLFNSKCEEFLLQLMLEIAEFKKLSGQKGPGELVRCRVGDSLGDVVLRCSLYGIHRIWLVDEEGKPLKCLRVEDLLMKFSGIDKYHD